MDNEEMEKVVTGLKNYISGTYQNTEGYVIVRLDQQGKVSGSYFAPDSERAAHLESIVAPKLLQIAADLEQLDRWNKITKLEGSGEQETR